MKPSERIIKKAQELLAAAKKDQDKLDSLDLVILALETTIQAVMLEMDELHEEKKKKIITDLNHQEDVC